MRLSFLGGYAICSLIAAHVLVLSIPVYANSSPTQLQQLILETGSLPPTINPVVVNDGHPIITGTFDAAYTDQLRVDVNGVWYVLGVDSELTANGDDWTLDLSELNPPLAPGSYNIIVETTTIEGATLSATISFSVPGQPNPNENGQSTNPGGLSGTGRSLIAATIGGIVLIVTAILLLLPAPRQMLRVRVKTNRQMPGKK